MQALLQGIGTGEVPVTVSAFDQYGNPASQTASIRVDLVAPVLNSLAVFGDNVLNVADSLLNQTISGVVGNAPVGSRVEVQVAGKTFLGSLDCAQTFGMVVLYGGASGPAPAIEPELLNKKGCLYLTRPSVFPHNADATRFRANAKDLFDAIAAGPVFEGAGVHCRGQGPLAGRPALVGGRP